MIIFTSWDESERATAGDFDTLEVAHERCRNIVEDSLDHLHQPGMTAEELREGPLWRRPVRRPGPAGRAP
jgi:hypothetical protein